jgi:hypothetical protein
MRAKVTERQSSSPDEFPMQRSPEDSFSGLIDLWERFGMSQTRARPFF